MLSQGTQIRVDAWYTEKAIDYVRVNLLTNRLQPMGMYLGVEPINTYRDLLYGEGN